VPHPQRALRACRRKGPSTVLWTRRRSASGLGNVNSLLRCGGVPGVCRGGRRLHYRPYRVPTSPAARCSAVFPVLRNAPGSARRWTGVPSTFLRDCALWYIYILICVRRAELAGSRDAPQSAHSRGSKAGSVGRVPAEYRYFGAAALAQDWAAGSPLRRLHAVM
jgi:hypothetical protein